MPGRSSSRKRTSPGSLPSQSTELASLIPGDQAELGLDGPIRKKLFASNNRNFMILGIVCIFVFIVVIVWLSTLIGKGDDTHPVKPTDLPVTKLPITKSPISSTSHSSTKAAAPKSSEKSFKIVNFNEELNRVINSPLNPCDDFYDYVCFNWTRPMALMSLQNELYQYLLREAIKSEKKQKQLPVAAVHLIINLYFECEQVKNKMTCLDEIEKGHVLICMRLFLEYIEQGDLAPMEAAREKATELVDHLRKSFATLLLNHASTWLDKLSSKRVQLKLSKMNTLIGFPDFIFNDDTLNELYGISDNRVPRLTGNYERDSVEVAYRLFDGVEAIEQANPELASKVWSNAFEGSTYDYEINTLIVPVHQLNIPQFDVNFPAVFNFGSIGFTIGHEMVHGYDSNRLTYDPSGRDGWKMLSDSARNYFIKGAQCLIKQYGALQHSATVKVNGVTTLDENICDNVGVKLAFFALRQYLKRHGADDPLLFTEKLKAHFNVDQQFFVAFAHIWCSSPPTARFLKKLENDAHTLKKYRVNVPLQNFDEFSKAFNCPEGSPMNPVEKCSIW